jgi:MFS family permease
VHFWRIRKDGGLGRPGGTPTSAGKGAAAIDADAGVVETSAASPTAGEAEAALTPSEAGAKTFGLMAVVRDRTPATNLDPEDTVPSWPYLLRAELFIFMACVLLSLLLGLFFDAPLKEAANPSIPENPAKAPWYFLGLQEMVSYSAFMGGLVIPAIVVLGLTLIPYLDREPGEAGIYLDNDSGRRVAWRSLLFGAVAAILTVAIPVNFGWLRSWFPGVPRSTCSSARARRGWRRSRSSRAS